MENLKTVLNIIIFENLAPEKNCDENLTSATQAPAAPKDEGTTYTRTFSKELQKPIHNVLYLYVAVMFS
jgi:hypothetical protein